MALANFFWYLCCNVPALYRRYRISTEKYITGARASNAMLRHAGRNTLL